MSKQPTDYDWANDQLDVIRAQKNVREAVIALLKAWDELSVAGDAATEAIEIFGKLSLGKPSVDEDPDETWIDAGLGIIQAGDIVRVKVDAFEGKLGEIHNGRKGVVLGVRWGDVIVRSTDGRKPLIDSAHYPPSKLDRRTK